LEAAKEREAAAAAAAALVENPVFSNSPLPGPMPIWDFKGVQLEVDMEVVVSSNPSRHQAKFAAARAKVASLNVDGEAMVEGVAVSFMRQSLSQSVVCACSGHGGGLPGGACLA
jgi:hypothetical protein